MTALAQASPRPGGRFSYAHAAVAEHPATIEKQIRRIESEIERFSRHRQRMVDSGRWHPHMGADVIHELRSVLNTLRQVKAQTQAEIAQGATR